MVRISLTMYVDFPILSSTPTAVNSPLFVATCLFDHHSVTNMKSRAAASRAASLAPSRSGASAAGSRASSAGSGAEGKRAVARAPSSRKAATMEEKIAKGKCGLLECNRDLRPPCHDVDSPDTRYFCDRHTETYEKKGFK